MKYFKAKTLSIFIRSLFYLIDRISYFFFYRFKQNIQIIIPPDNNCLTKAYKVLAVFAIYQPKALSLLVQRSIQYLYKHKIKIMIIAPHVISVQDIAFLKKYHCIVLTRFNFGRDFGSYKYGILYLLANPNLLQAFEKIILLNDGIFFPIKENDSMLKKILTYSHDVIGLAENYQYNWHIGSYFILFKREFLLHKKIKNFWINYKPYSSRFHTIKKGEVTLGKKIKQLTDSCKIIYNGKKLLSALEKALLVQHPIRFIQIASNYLTQDKALLYKAFFLSKKHVNLSLIGAQIENYSPAHIFALALIEYLDCFFIKRDICYRGLYSISQVIHYLSSKNSDENLIDALNIDLKNKGIITSMPIFKKILCTSGAI
jgi:hypothetical protein